MNNAISQLIGTCLAVFLTGFLVTRGRDLFTLTLAMQGWSRLSLSCGLAALVIITFWLWYHAVTRYMAERKPTSRLPANIDTPQEDVWPPPPSSTQARVLGEDGNK